MAEITKLQASPREVTGKKVRFLRRDGIIPANLFGKKEPSVAVQVDNHELEHLLATHQRSQVLSVVLEGREESALISHVQRHPTRRSLLHVDFHRIALDVVLQVPVRLEFIGEAPAVRMYEGMLLNNLSEVVVEGLPTAIPETIQVDVSALADLESAIYVRELQAPSGITIVSDPDELITKVMPPTVEAVRAEEAVEELGEVPPTSEEKKEED